MHSCKRYRYVPILAVLVGVGFAAPAALARDRRGHGDHRDGFGWRISVGSDGFGVHVRGGDAPRYRSGHKDYGRHHRRYRRHHRRRHQGHAADCRLIAGHYAHKQVRVLVEPAHYAKRWVEPVYETRRRGRRGYGRPYTVCVREGYYETIHIPARYEYQAQRYWVPARRVCVAACGGF